MEVSARVQLTAQETSEEEDEEDTKKNMNKKRKSRLHIPTRITQKARWRRPLFLLQYFKEKVHRQACYQTERRQHQNKQGTISAFLSLLLTLSCRVAADGETAHQVTGSARQPSPAAMTDREATVRIMDPPLISIVGHQHGTGLCS